MKVHLYMYTFKFAFKDFISTFQLEATFTNSGQGHRSRKGFVACQTLCEVVGHFGKW